MISFLKNEARMMSKIEVFMAVKTLTRLCCEAAWSCTWLLMFWRNASLPFKVKAHSTLKMEAIHSSKTLVNTYKIIQLQRRRSQLKIVRMIKSRWMRLTEHVAHMGEIRNVYKILIRQPKGERPFQRQRNIPLHTCSSETL
jgi:hypothetical protein